MNVESSSRDADLSKNGRVPVELKRARPGAGHSRDSLIGCMTSRSEAPSKFQVPKSAGLLSATRLPLYALISRARKNGGGGHMESGPCPILPPRPTGSITGYGATQFNCIAESIPLKRKASPIPLHRD